MSAAADTSSFARHRARRAAVQALYQWQMTGQDAREIEGQFVGGRELERADGAFFSALLNAVVGGTEELDRMLEPWLDRPVERLDLVERAILRMGAYELDQRPDIPVRVVLNEAIRLARIFGAEESHKYINGVLDRVAHAVRAGELRAGRTGGG